MKTLEETTSNLILKASKEWPVRESHRACLKPGSWFMWFHVSHGSWEGLEAASVALGEAECRARLCVHPSSTQNASVLVTPKEPAVIHHCLFWGPISQICVSVSILVWILGLSCKLSFSSVFKIIDICRREEMPQTMRWLGFCLFVFTRNHKHFLKAWTCIHFSSDT